MMSAFVKAKRRLKLLAPSLPILSMLPSLWSLFRSLSYFFLFFSLNFPSHSTLFMFFVALLFRAFFRIGSCYEAMDRLEDALKAYENSFLENRSKEALNKKNEVFFVSNLLADFFNGSEDYNCCFFLSLFIRIYLFVLFSNFLFFSCLLSLNVKFVDELKLLISVQKFLCNTRNVETLCSKSRNFQRWIDLLEIFKGLMLRLVGWLIDSES